VSAIRQQSTPRGRRIEVADASRCTESEDTYEDIINYIIRTAHRISENQDAGYICDTYAPGCLHYAGSEATYGADRAVDQSPAPFSPPPHRYVSTGESTSNHGAGVPRPAERQSLRDQVG